MRVSRCRLGLWVVFLVATFLLVLTPALSHACTCGGLQCWGCPPWPPNFCGGVLNPACSTNGCQNANCTCETPTCSEAPAVPCGGDITCACAGHGWPCPCPKTCPITTLEPCGGAVGCQTCGNEVCACLPVCGGPARCGGQTTNCACGGTGCACAPHCQGEPPACGGTATSCNCGVAGCDCGQRCAPQFCAQQVGLCMCLGAGCDCTTATTCDGLPPCGGTAEVCSLAQGGGCAKAGCDCGTFCGHAGDPPCDGGTPCTCSTLCAVNGLCYTQGSSLCPADKCSGTDDCQCVAGGCGYCPAGCPRREPPCGEHRELCIPTYRCTPISGLCNLLGSNDCAAGCCSSEERCPDVFVYCDCCADEEYPWKGCGNGPNGAKCQVQTCLCGG